MRWHVEQAIEPPHAPANARVDQAISFYCGNTYGVDVPSRSISYSCASDKRSSPSFPSIARITSPLASLNVTLILQTTVSAQGVRNREDTFAHPVPGAGRSMCSWRHTVMFTVSVRSRRGELPSYLLTQRIHARLSRATRSVARLLAVPEAQSLRKPHTDVRRGIEQT